MTIDYNEEFKSPAQIVNFYNADQFRASDHDRIIVGLQLGQASNSNSICSRLGDDRSRILHDLDVIEFTGAAGEQVSVILDVDPNGDHGGERATLIWKDKIRRVSFPKLDRSALPNQLNATMPASGRYLLSFKERAKFLPGTPFKGDYYLTAISTDGAAQTLSRYRLVD